jgi:radical SAM-linked protein
MSFGPALALGTRSVAEFADVTLCEEIDEAALLDKLTESSETGLVFTGARRLSDQEPGLSKLIDTVDFLFLLPADGESQINQYRKRCQEAMARQTLPVTVTRKGTARALDIKDLILDARVDKAGVLCSQPEIPRHRCAVRFRLQLREGPSVRPTELVQEIFGVTVQSVDVIRIHCGYLDESGNLQEPIAVKIVEGS